MVIDSCNSSILWPISVYSSLITGTQSQHDIPVTVTPGSVNVSPGAQVVFTCRYNVPRNSHQMKLQWRKYAASQQSVLLWTAKTTLTTSTRSFSGPGAGYNQTMLNGSPSLIPDVLSRHSLSFLRIRSEDSGQYYCEVSYLLPDKTFKSGKSPPFRITVKGNQPCDTLICALYDKMHPKHLYKTPCNACHSSVQCRFYIVIPFSDRKNSGHK